MIKNRTSGRFFTGKAVLHGAVQHGLGRVDTGNPQTFWVEFPDECPLFCKYCYANGGEGRDCADLLTREEYVSILNQASALGVDSIGIPGAGEPFYGSNFELTMWFLQQCAERNIYVTLFTTGQFITDELAKALFDLPVEIMLKGNSLNPERQDRFVSNEDEGKIVHGYGEARNRAIETLMEAGFNNKEAASKHGRVSRMALVTSIMTDEKEGGLSNIDEIEEIYRFCRDRNIIADIDTILERGRATKCGISAGSGIKEVLVNLGNISVNEYGDDGAFPCSTYVGTACDRFRQHLYIDKTGRIRPCIGSMDVYLGNIRDTRLVDAWNTTERRIIRELKYDGPCASCLNFKEGNCFSCLGRFTPAEGDKRLSNESLLRDGCVHTTGCPLRRPS